MFSLLTKKARVVGKWEFEINPNNNGTNWLNNASYTTLYEGDEIEFTKDMKVLWNNVNYGTWKFDDAKEIIVISGGVGPNYWYILKLRNNNLWVDYFDHIGPSNWEWHFKRIK